MPGVTSGVQNDLIVVPPNDLEAVEAAFRETQPACCIIEGTGGHWGLVPVQGPFLKGLRELCTRYGVILIFDEVISGFRVHPGGSQGFYGVTPDMTTLAKILAGGLPGGAVAGREDLLDAIAFGNRYGKKMKHPGTYNGNPLSAAAGCAALDAIADGTACEAATAAARSLRARLNELFARRNAPCVAYGEFSMVHILPNYDGPRPGGDDVIPCDNDYRKLDGEQPAALKHAFRCALLLGGVDWFGWSGMTSTAHTAQDIDQTVTAFDKALDLLM
jgi:glutamate-1-semialdehyde 2,1-aminomutase